MHHIPVYQQLQQRICKLIVKFAAKARRIYGGKPLLCLVLADQFFFMEYCFSNPESIY
jgi:hypothetical protein